MIARNIHTCNQKPPFITLKLCIPSSPSYCIHRNLNFTVVQYYRDFKFHWVFQSSLKGTSIFTAGISSSLGFSMFTGLFIVHRAFNVHLALDLTWLFNFTLLFNFFRAFPYSLSISIFIEHFHSGPFHIHWAFPYSFNVH